MENILIVIAAAICCLLAAFALRQRPNASFALLLICIVAGPVVVLSVGVKTVPLLFADLYLPAWLLVALCTQRRTKMSSYVKVAVIALSVFLITSALVSAVTTRDFLKALFTWKNYLEGLAALYLGGTYFRTWPRLRAAVTCLYVFGGALVLELIANSYLGSGGNLWTTLGANKNAAQTGFGQSNYIAGLIILVMPLAATALGRSVKHVLVGAACTLLMLLGLVVTASRGAILAIAVGTVVAMMFRPKRMLITVLVTLGCAAIAWTVVPESFVSVLEQRFDILQTDRNTIERLALWDESWRMFQGQPIFGVGIKGSGFEYLANNSSTVYTDAHNFVLTLLCETGLVGTVLYLLAMLACVRGGLTAISRCSVRKDKFLLFACLFGLGVSTLHSLVEIMHGGPEYSILVWTMLGLLGSSSLIPPPQRRMAVIDKFGRGRAINGSPVSLACPLPSPQTSGAVETSSVTLARFRPRAVRRPI
jgi:O-antigen ligase